MEGEKWPRLWPECPWCGGASTGSEGHTTCTERATRLWDETYSRGVVDHGQPAHAKDEADKALEYLRKSHGLWRA